MVYCVQIFVAYSNATRRDQAQAAIITRSGAKPRWGADVVVTTPLDPGANGLVVEWRFTNQADADDLYTFLSTRIPTPVVGSTLIQHNCRHDEGRNECVIVKQRSW